MEKALRNQRPGDEAARTAAAFVELAASPELNLLYRYETRLHRIYQRALYNLVLLGECKLPNEPSPISEHRPREEEEADLGQAGTRARLASPYVGAGQLVRAKPDARPGCDAVSQHRVAETHRGASQHR